MSPYMNTFVDYVFDNTGIYVNAERIYSFSASNIPNSESSDNILLFALGTQKTTLGNVSLGVTRLYKDNQLVRNFVPVKRDSDNAYGMYDTVTGAFFGNAGMGSFTGE